MFFKKILSCISMMLVLFMLVTAPVHTTHKHNDSDAVTVVSADYHTNKRTENTNHCDICISCTHCNHFSFVDMQNNKNYVDNQVTKKYIPHSACILSYSLTDNILKPPQYILS